MIPRFPLLNCYLCNPPKLHSVTAHASAGLELLLHIISGLVEYSAQSSRWQYPASQVLPPLGRAGSMHCRVEVDRAAITPLAPAPETFRSSLLWFLSLIHTPYQSIHVLSRPLKSCRAQNVSEVSTGSCPLGHDRFSISSSYSPTLCQFSEDPAVPLHPTLNLKLTSVFALALIPSCCPTSSYSTTIDR